MARFNIVLLSIATAYGAHATNPSASDSAILPQFTRLGDCVAQTHVLLGAPNKSELYDPAIHGTNASTLRLFPRVEDGCRFNLSDLKYGNRVNVTDVQTDATGLSLSKRGIFAWAASKVFFAGIAFGAWIGGQLCSILDRHNKLNENGMIACDVLNVIGVAAAAYSGFLHFKAGGFTTSAAASVAGDLNKRSELAFEPTLKLYHVENDTAATWESLAAANATHPINVYVHGKLLASLPSSFDQYRNETLLFWHEESPQVNASRRMHVMTQRNEQTKQALRKRQGGECDAEDQSLGDGETLCEGETFPPTSWPYEFYMGGETYGTQANWNEFNDDLGETYTESNGLIGSLQAVGDDMGYYGTWDECVCGQTNNGDYIFTSTVQATWNGVYNGYSPCWDADCYDA